MQYPTVKPIRTSREILDVFRGYHHDLYIGKGEFYEMENLTSDHYPLLSPRGVRGFYATPGIPQGMIARESLCYVDGGDIVIGGTRVPMGLTVDQEPKTLVSMGAYIIVMPDKKYLNTADVSDRGNIGASVTTESETVFALCDFEGNVFEKVFSQWYQPDTPSDGDYWVDTSENPGVVRRYDLGTESWVRIFPTYVRISSPGIGLCFSVGDGVTVSGAEHELAVHLNTTATVKSKGDDFIVIRGLIHGKVTQSTPVTVARSVPDMDFMFECENRLWGCKSGVGANGEILNTIYACKRGDFRNWRCFDGEYSDSFEVTVGSGGDFTGAVAYLGYPLFFKENCVHKIYGTTPLNYQVQTTVLRGVQKGSSRSLAVVSEVLYYKSQTGICAYDGSLPVEISEPLGEGPYHKAAAGARGNKYYVSMSDDVGVYHLFVYDTARRMWHREDNTQATLFCACGSELHYIDYATNRIMNVDGKGQRETEPFKWSATSGIIGTDSPDKKYVSRMDVRLKLDVGTRVAFFIEYDSSGDFEYLFTMTGKSLQSFSVPIRPKRCDHLRLRIVGMGEAKIFSICKTLEYGSV